MVSKRAMAVGGLVPAVVLTVGPGVASASPVPSGPTVIASGLNNPRQLAFGPDGTLYVADAGSGKVGATDTSGGCATGPEGGTVCAGNTGDVTAIGWPAVASGQTVRKVVSGLLSVADEGTGAGATGIDAVAPGPYGTGVGIMTVVNPTIVPQSVAYQNGKLLSTVPGHAVVADVGTFTLTHPQPGHAPESDPYGITVVGTTGYVADAAGNTLLAVTPNGAVRQLTVFHYRHGDGSDGSYDAVPTAVTPGPYQGRQVLYVADLGSLMPGAANIYAVDPDTGAILHTWSGFTGLNGIAVDPAGTIYATSLFAPNPVGPPGALVTIPAGGSPTATPVPLPGGVAVRGGHVYVSEFSTVAGGGMVVRLH
jgi:hypothetical protein